MNIYLRDLWEWTVGWVSWPEVFMGEAIVYSNTGFRGANCLLTTA